MRGGQDAAGPPGGRDAPAGPVGQQDRRPRSWPRKAGTTAGAAKDAMDTSQRLPGQPELDRALRRGELSPAQAGLISAAAAADPSAETPVDRTGRASVAGGVAGRMRPGPRGRGSGPRGDQPAATCRPQVAPLDRLEGFWNLHAKGTPQAGALFNTVLDPITDRIFKTARTQGRREHPDAYAFDALIHLAEHAAGHCNCQADTTGANTTGADGAAAAGAAAARAEPAGTETAGGNEAAEADAAGAGAAGADADAAGTAGTETAGRDEAAQADAAGADGVGADAALDGAASRDAGPVTAPATGDPGIFAAPAGATGSAGQSGSGCAVRPSTNPRYLALLRIDAQALRRGQVAGEELCEIAGVGPVPVSVARDLLGEAIVKLVITNGVDVANVTHLGRGRPPRRRSPCCGPTPPARSKAVTGRRIEYDHQKPWAQTRHTRLDELDPLCGFHHDLKTRLHWSLVPGTGKRAFVAPDDPRHPSRQPTRAGPTASNTRPPTASTSAPARKRRPTETADARPPTVPGPANPPGKAGPPARRAASAQMTLPEPPAEQAPQPP